MRSTGTMRWANLLAVLAIISPGVFATALGAEANDPIVGRWKWFTKETKTFHADGSITKDGNWRCVNPGHLPRKYVIVWSEGKFVDVMVLGNDGNRLSGRNDVGVEVFGDRLSREDADQPVVASTSGSIRTDLVTEWQAEVASGHAEAAPKNAPNVNLPSVEPPGGLEDIIAGLFQRYPATHILVSGALDIYISDEGIYVIQRKWIDPGNAENAALWENWNFAVTADGVFEWQTGQKNGIKIARKDRDVLDYLLYLIGATGFEMALYDGYLREPDKFKVVPGKGGKWKEFQLKTPMDGFEAVYLTEKPLWFYGLRVRTPERGTVERLISAPEQIEKIPAAVKTRLREIHFADSPLSLARHIVWP